MRPMKPFMACCASAALLAACATPTVYQPATGPETVGYSSTMIEDRRLRVSFRTGADATPQQAQDYALRRAAELTLQRGHDWFEVTNRFVEPAAASSGPRFSVGLGGGDYGGSTAVGGGVGVGFGGGGGRGAAVATLEIVMGDGEKPESVNAYDARAVAASLGAG